jgi:hypothetical protein
MVAVALVAALVAADEAAEYPRWLEKMARAGVTLGPRSSRISSSRIPSPRGPLSLLEPSAV